MTPETEQIGRSMSNNSFLFFVLILMLSCADNSNNKSNNPNKQQISAKVFVPDFSSDSAYAFIEKQVSFGTRELGSPGSKNCGIYLENQLKKYTSLVVTQEAPVTTYDRKKHKLKNIIASFSPEKKNRILLMAHWDTRPIADYDTIRKGDPILGANDGGSGVGVLLELARQFSINQK